MSHRVTFHKAGFSPFPAAPDDGYTAQWSRVKFVKGWVDDGGAQPAGTVECGDGTAYPLQATAAQIHEMFYRVRDSKFTAGEMTIFLDFGGGYTEIGALTINFAPIPAALVTGSGHDDALYRGYCTVITGQVGVDPEPMADYGTAYFSAAYDYSPAFGHIVREASSEFAMWAGNATAAHHGAYDFVDPLTSFYWVPSGAAFLHSVFRTGLDYVAHNAGNASLAFTPAGYPYAEAVVNAGGSGLVVNFNNEVAFVDNAGNGNPFDPANDLYVGMIFSLGCDSVIVTTDIDAAWGVGSPPVAPPVAAGADFEIELSDSVVSCPLYWEDIQSGAYNTTLTPVTNFRLKATEWWEYADKAGAPAWDSTTGLPIHGGPTG